MTVLLVMMAITILVVAEVGIFLCSFMVSLKYLSEATFVPTLYSNSNWSLKDRKEQSNLQYSQQFI